MDGRGEYGLIRGSCPGPFLARFCIEEVVEKGDVGVGSFCWRHCGRVKLWRIGCRVVLGLYARKTGRKVERFIVGGGDAR